MDIRIKVIPEDFIVNEWPDYDRHEKRGDEKNRF